MLGGFKINIEHHNVLLKIIIHLIIIYIQQFIVQEMEVESPCMHV